MLFVAILTHSPENCFMRPENAKAAKEASEIFEKMEGTAKKLGVKLIGDYVNMNEHTLYFIFETDNYAAVSKVLGPPLLTYHTAKITPVTRMKEAVARLPKK